MDSPKLSITRTEGTAAGPLVLHLDGPLVMATTADFQKSLRTETAQVLILDFTAVPFIDSAGLGSLISIFLHFKNGGRKLALIGLNEKGRALLKMTNVENLFPTYATVEAALAALA
ncbi:MAG: STAS domain-containing protein [Candidatus Acidiferrales bacterium]